MSDPVGLSAAQLSSVRESVGAVNIWEGAVSSGKTIGSLLRFLIEIAQAPSSGSVAIIGRTKDSIARNILGPLMDPGLFGDIAALTTYTRGANLAKILGRDVEVIGANDAKAEPKIRGLTIAVAYVDEITTLPEDVFTRLLDRIRVPGARLFGTTNPDSPAHWFKAKFLDRMGDADDDIQDWRRFHFLMDDNPVLPAAYKVRMHRELTGLWRRRFILGEWVAAEGAVYDMWDPERHVVPWAELPYIDRLIGVGIDYGTRNATSAILLGMTRAGSLVLVDEWRHDSRVAGVEVWTDAQQSAALQEWLAQKHTPQVGDPPIEQIYLDPSAASLSRQMWQDGIGNVHADNNVTYGIRIVATLLGQGRLIVSDRCTGFINEAPGYVWDDKATARGVDQPKKGSGVSDHSMDAARYAVCSTEPIWREALVDRIGVAVLRHQLEDEYGSGGIDFMTEPM
jgi:PBSX family phage terminase large subunit